MVLYTYINKGENKMKIIDMSTSSVLLDEVSKVEDNLRDYNSSLNNILYEIIPVIRQLVNERNDRLTATEPTGDFVGSLATLMARVDELENTDGGMAVMKLQDAIDECDEVCGNHEERIDELENDIQSIERRLDGATIEI
jgi:chromosome segregation ATPase